MTRRVAVVAQMVMLHAAARVAATMMLRAKARAQPMQLVVVLRPRRWWRLRAPVVAATVMSTMMTMVTVVAM